jgi:ATP-binding cassette subfamily B protein
MFIGTASTSLVLGLGGYEVIHLGIGLSVLTIFIQYAGGFFDPVQQIANTVTNVVATQVNIERIFSLMEKTPDVVDRPDVIEKYGDTFHPKVENWEPVQGAITFQDVTFRYPDGNENVLEHFSLTIPAGTYVAIVGETGAGKSTLVNLACRFFEPTEGIILVDGTDYRERSQLWLHSALGYVLQNPHLFSGSVRENIRYGRLEATDEEVEEAARTVSADTFIQNMENGYDTDVGEGGDRLSTGEKQLISFARAVLANPRIFVLDEATSSIDTDTELLIQKAISQLLNGRTSFVIAHRLSTIRHADIILVVSDGKIVEQGTHPQLIHAKGEYYRLFTRQFEEDAEQQVLSSL